MTRYLDPLWISGLLVTILLASVITALRPENFGRGRLTRMLRRVLPWRPLWSTSLRLRIFRVVSVVLAIIVPLSLQFPHARFISTGYVTWFTAAAFAVDDYLTGNDDKWRRFWRGARNKVRWLMRLPAREPQGGTT